MGHKNFQLSLEGKCITCDKKRNFYFVSREREADKEIVYYACEVCGHEIRTKIDYKK